MIDKLLFMLTSNMHCRCILLEGKPYLERYFITSRHFLHRFVGIDGERNVHDHPFKWSLSIILLGWYIEKLHHGLSRNIVKRRWFNFIGQNYFHRIIKSYPKTWTLFMTGKRVREWGILHDDGEYEVMPSQPGVSSYKDYPLGKDNKARVPLGGLSSE